MMGLHSMEHNVLPPLAPSSQYPLYELSTIHSCHTLADALIGCSTPFAAPTDPPSSFMYTSTPPSRKRRATVDEFSHFDAWKLNEDISFNLQSFSQLINADTPFPNDNYASNTSLVNASYNCNDLEDVLNFLWMEDDTASTTQSAASPHACSDQISLISELDLDYGSNESSSNQGELGDDPSMSDTVYSLRVEQAEQQGAYKQDDHDCLHTSGSCWPQKKEGGSDVRASWQQQTTRATWQGKTRASWQDEGRASWQDETRASWQPKQGGARASWQPKQGGVRASWQQKKEAGTRASRQAPAATCKEHRVTSPVGSVFSSEKQGAPNWPALLEIESALAFSGSPYLISPPTPSSSNIIKHDTPPFSDLKKLLATTTKEPPTPSSSNIKHDTPPFIDLKKLLATTTGQPPQHDTLNSSWRLKLQKRNCLEPKYTVKVESEEKAIGDGYRWRKYGQKSIKNNPFPRSYYRCSTGKCNAKKQVEKCQDDGGLVLVTYEGIHLHHRPNPLQKICMLADLHEDESMGKSPAHIFSPSSSTS